MPGLPEPGVEWAGFRIEERIGAGGFGQLYSAWDPAADRRVVLKVVAGEPGDPGVQRFLRESRLAAELDHPRIVPIHRVDEVDGMAVVVMDQIGGGDLAQQIATAPLTLDRTRSVLGQLGGALDRAHRAGLVHRSVEPANVLCAEDGDEVFLTDFGSPAASVHHASPEFVRGEVLTPASDVYSLGSTLFECLTGRVPFPAATPAEVADHHLATPPPRVTDLRPDLPPALDDAVAQAMAKDPTARHPSTRHLAEAVALVRAGDARTVVSPPVPPPTAATAAAFPTTAATPIGPTEDAPPVEPEEPVRRSVFDDTPALPVDAADAPTTVSAPVPPGRPVDGAAFGVYEEEGPRSRLPAIVAGVLVVATLVVAGLVWRAVNTDADLASGSGTTTTTEPPPDLGTTAPTVAAAEALVPEGIDTCVSPEGEAAETVPIVLLCPIDGVPEAMSVELFSTADERDAHYDSVAAELGVSDRDDAECALGRMGSHTYTAEGHAGRVACQEAAGVVDFLWTRDDAPVVLRAHGGGRFADYEQAWEELAGRTDAQFPVPEEQALLDALPDALLEDCSRDLTLALEAGGRVAAACRPADAAPTVISWVLFDDGSRMDDWIGARRDSLDENTFDQTDDGCSPQGFGQVASITEEPVDEPDEEGGDDEGEADATTTTAAPSGPPPDAAFLDYDLDGTSGSVLCFINTSGLNAVFWTRDGSRIASIAVSDRTEGDSMVDLLRWWRDGGHLP